MCVRVCTERKIERHSNLQELAHTIMEVEKSGPGIAECTVPSESEGLKARKRGASPIRVSVRKLGEPLV